MLLNANKQVQSEQIEREAYPKLSMVLYPLLLH